MNGRSRTARVCNSPRRRCKKKSLRTQGAEKIKSNGMEETRKTHKKRRKIDTGAGATLHSIHRDTAQSVNRAHRRRSPKACGVGGLGGLDRDGDHPGRRWNRPAHGS